MPKKKIEEKLISKKKEEVKTKKNSYYMAVGRRKTARARVKLQVGGTGKILVNRKPVEEYFSGEVAKKIYLEPLVLINSLERFDIFATIDGSGKSAQLGAFVHGLSRAIQKIDRQNYRPVFKKGGFLTRDPRAKERRKAGLAQKARKQKQSPKR